MPAFVPYGTAGGAHRDELAGRIAAVAGRIYEQAEQQICRLLARLAARVLRGGLLPGLARRNLARLGAAILARAAHLLERELALAERQVRSSAASAAAGGLAAIGVPRHHEAAAAGDAGWGNLRDRVRGAGLAALRTASAALASVTGAAQMPPEGTRAARQAAQAAAISAAMGALPVQLDAYTDTAGRTWRLGTYIRAAVGAAAALLHIAWQMITFRKAGLGLVIVEPAGGCVKCAPWAGKILSLTDAVPAGSSAVGTVADALSAGLGHPHCRHDFIPVTG